MSDKERRQMNVTELQALQKADQRSKDDCNIFTTKHYFFGMKIMNAWKRKIDARKILQRQRETKTALNLN